MKNFLYILLLAILVSCWGCSGGGEDVPTPTPTPKPEEKPKVEVTTAAPVLSQEGGNSTVTFSSTDSWTIDVSEGRSVSWCSVTPTSGGKGTHTLTIQTAANDTYDERNAKVTIKAGTTTQSFVVTQKQKDAIIVAKNEYTMEAAGGELKLEVNSNVNFKVETSVSWIKQNSGSRGLEAKSLNFMVEENTTDGPREGMITISSGDLKQTIKVIQQGTFIAGTVGELESGGGIEEG